MAITRAWEYGHRISSAYAISGIRRSSVYVPAPIAFCTDSSRGVWRLMV